MIPKPKRIDDPDMVKYVLERDEDCMARGLYPPCYGPHTVHHIVHRGAGGGDTKENMIRLCYKHHRFVHDGMISKEWLLERLRKKYGYKT